MKHSFKYDGQTFCTGDKVRATKELAKHERYTIEGDLWFYNTWFYLGNWDQITNSSGEVVTSIVELKLIEKAKPNWKEAKLIKASVTEGFFMFVNLGNQRWYAVNNNQAFSSIFREKDIFRTYPEPRVIIDADGDVCDG